MSWLDALFAWPVLLALTDPPPGRGREASVEPCDAAQSGVQRPTREAITSQLDILQQQPPSHPQLQAFSSPLVALRAAAMSVASWTPSALPLMAPHPIPPVPSLLVPAPLPCLLSALLCDVLQPAVSATQAGAPLTTAAAAAPAATAAASAAAAGSDIARTAGTLTRSICNALVLLYQSEWRGHEATAAAANARGGGQLRMQCGVQQRQRQKHLQ